MRFTKMQGTGNDYIYVDCTRETPPDLPALAIRLSKPHFGVGSDGLICICPSEKADFRMRVFNADGSEGEMCGNGLRCVCKYVYDKGLTQKTVVDVETLAGVKRSALHLTDGKVSSVTVDMGEPKLTRTRLLTVHGRDYLIAPVSMGNPHVVVFMGSIDALDLNTIGPGFENHPDFAPDRVNTEFVGVVSQERLRMRVWERGSGETLACGTGACAAVVAATMAGRSRRHATVVLQGGELDIRWDESDDHVYMTGPAVTVFEGEVEI